MPETTSAFKAYLKDLKKNTLPKQSKNGKLETALAEELSRKNDDEPEVDAAA